MSRNVCATLGFEAQGSVTYQPAHVINLEVKDNHEDATLGAFLILELCIMVGELWYFSSISYLSLYTIWIVYTSQIRSNFNSFEQAIFVIVKPHCRHVYQ